MYLNALDNCACVVGLNLTLTRVVFEYFKAPISPYKPFYLTLTRVVFELRDDGVLICLTYI